MLKNRYNLIILALGMVFVLGGCLNKVENKPVAEVKLKPVVVVEKKSDEKVDEKVDEVKSGEEVDTSDWLTYRNEELGFEVKYPKGWFLGDKNIYSQGQYIYSYDPKKDVDNKGEILKPDKVSIWMHSSYLCSQTETIPNCLPGIKDHVKKISEESLSDDVFAYNYSQEYIIHDGADGVITEYKTIRDDNILTAYHIEAYFIKDSKVYVVDFYLNYTDYYKNIFKAFLNTIHFF